MKLYALNGGGYTAVINLTRGANCVSLRHTATGAEILREPDYARALDNPYLYGMPILFPVNRISGGNFLYDGREYRFPVNEEATGCHLHGFLHETEFALESLSQDHIAAVLEREAGEIYAGFPHALRIRTEYALSENGLLHRVEIVNRSGLSMPCLLGFHTTFRAAFLPETKAEDVRASVTIEEEYERDMKTYLPTGQRPSPDSVTARLSSGEFCPTREKISRHYRGNGRMTLTDVRAGTRVVYIPDGKLPFRLIYNGDADEYICLEPQTSLANSPNAPFPREEAGFLAIPPHESVTFESVIYLEKEKDYEDRQA